MAESNQDTMTFPKTRSRPEMQETMTHETNSGNASLGIGYANIAESKQGTMTSETNSPGIGCESSYGSNDFLRDVHCGFEKARQFRLMVVGPFGVGKTTLIRRLCETDISSVYSTTGIDIHCDNYEITDNGNWRNRNEDKEQSCSSRLQGLSSKYAEPKEEDNVVTALATGGKVYDSISSNEKTLGTFRIGNNRSEEIDMKFQSACRAIQKGRTSVSIWDFAGQSVYYSTHHFFLSPRTIYLLTLDLSRDLHESFIDGHLEQERQSNLALGSIRNTYTCLDVFKFWVKSIYMYSKYWQINGERYVPKIILVGTHKDKVKSYIHGVDSAERYKNDYFSKALSDFHGTPIMELIHETSYFVSCAYNDKGFHEIRKEILKIAENQFLNESLPAWFIPLERVIMDSKEDKRQILKVDELEKISKDKGIPLPDNGISQFLRYQHSVGNICHFDGNDINDVIILRPQWIIDVFKAFVSHRRHRLPKTSWSAWKRFEKNGILELDLASTLLSHQDRDEQEIQYAIKFMENLDVFARPVTFSNIPVDNKKEKTQTKIVFAMDDSTVTTIEGNRYAMPCMLPTRPPLSILKEYFKKRATGPPVLCLYMKDGYLPPSVFHRILATCLREMPIEVANGEQILFNSLGSFEINRETHLTIWTVDNIISLKVSFKDASNEKEMARNCKHLKDCFIRVILRILNLEYNDLNVDHLMDYFVKCPKCKEQAPFEVKESENGPLQYIYGLFKVSDLLFRQRKQCVCCNEIVGKEILHWWFDNVTIQYRDDCGIPDPTGGPTNSSSGDVLQTHSHAASPENDHIALLKEVPGIQELADIAVEISKLGSLAQHLNVNGNKVEKIRYNFGYPHDNFIFHILLEWRKSRECWKTLLDAMKMANLPVNEVMKIASGEKRLIIEGECEQYRSSIQIGDCEDLDERQWAEVNSTIGDNYWLLGIWLGIKETRIQQISSNCQRCSEDIIRQIFSDWKRMDGDLNTLVRALYKSGCDMNDVVEVLRPCTDKDNI